MDQRIYVECLQVLMPHRNAPLTETGRLRLARCVVDEGGLIRRAAERFQVSHTTVPGCARRYRSTAVRGWPTGLTAA